MGHMNQRRQNIWSTCKVPIIYDIEYEAVTPVCLGSKTHLVYIDVIYQRQLYTDLTGIFPVRSSNDNWYIMICYSYE
jgi:E3 ubiquitin-protein ligase DOA10